MAITVKQLKEALEQLPDNAQFGYLIKTPVVNTVREREILNYYSVDEFEVVTIQGETFLRFVGQIKINTQC